MKNNFKVLQGFLVNGLVILVALLIGISIGFLGYYFYQKQSSTSTPSPTNLPSTQLPAPSEKPVQTPSFTEKPLSYEYPDVSLFYENKGEIWQFNPRSNLTKKIIQGKCPVISPNKRKIAYIRNSGVYIFDLLVQKEKLLKQYPEDFPVSHLSWSPDNKYLVVDTGTSPVRGKTIIDVSNQKEILSFTTLDDAYGWISNNEIVFTDLQKVSEPRPYGGGEGCGIAIINLKGEKKILKNATDKKDYSFLQIIDGKIYFSLTKVESNEGWGDKSKQTISYWMMDKSGKNLIKTKKVETLKEKIKKSLPSNYKVSFVREAVPLNKNENWVVFVLDQGSGSESEIFIMNLKEPESIKKIGKGICPSW